MDSTGSVNVSQENSLKTSALSELEPQAMSEVSTVTSESKRERIFGEIIADLCVW